MNLRHTLILLCLAPAAAEMEVEMSKPSAKAGMEFGQVVSGHHRDLVDSLLPVDMGVIQRQSVGITEQAIINNNLIVNIGVGGLFFTSYPIMFGQTTANLVKFGPGISEASARVVFEDVESSNTWLKLGFFPVKYNPDAGNLGEYLFRSHLYPGILRTGDWGIVNSAAYMAQGFQFHLEQLDGMLTHDLTLFMERDYAPFLDLTPSYLVGLKAGPLELGAGVSFHHLIARPSRLKPKNSLSTVVEMDLPQIVKEGSSDLADTIPAGRHVGLEAAMEKLKDQRAADNINSEFDTRLTNPYTRTLWVGPTGDTLTPVDSGWNDTEYSNTGIHEFPRTVTHITHKGIKLMARAALDPKYFFGGAGALLKPHDLRIFTEVAVIGIENQPYFYDDVMERIPIMFGINIPGFKILDLLSVQAEYYGNQFEPNLTNLYESQLPVWTLKENNHRLHKPYHEDDWRWSVVFSRQVTTGLSLRGQVASDHLRLLTYRWMPGVVPLAHSPGDWYYILKLEFGV